VVIARRELCDQCSEQSEEEAISVFGAPKTFHRKGFVGWVEPWRNPTNNISPLRPLRTLRKMGEEQENKKIKTQRTMQIL
jgi:hypothetical protein